jgi:hypothetical protein
MMDALTLLVAGAAFFFVVRAHRADRAMPRDPFVAEEEVWRFDLRPGERVDLHGVRLAALAANEMTTFAVAPMNVGRPPAPAAAAAPPPAIPPTSISAFEAFMAQRSGAGPNTVVTTQGKSISIGGGRAIDPIPWHHADDRAARPSTAQVEIPSARLSVAIGDRAETLVLTPGRIALAGDYAIVVDAIDPREASEAGAPVGRLAGRVVRVRGIDPAMPDPRPRNVGRRKLVARKSVEFQGLVVRLPPIAYDGLTAKLELSFGGKESAVRVRGGNVVRFESFEIVVDRLDAPVVGLKEGFAVVTIRSIDHEEGRTGR